MEIRRIASGTEWSELLCALLISSAPFWIFRVPAHIVRSMQNRKMWNPVLPLSIALYHSSDKSMRQAKIQDFPKAHRNSIFPNFALFCSIFGKCGTEVCLKKGHRRFSFFFGERTPQIYNKERQGNAKTSPKRALYQNYAHQMQSCLLSVRQSALAAAKNAGCRTDNFSIAMGSIQSRAKLPPCRMVTR